MSEQNNDHDLLIEISTKIGMIFQNHNEFKTSLIKLGENKCDRAEMESKFTEHSIQNDKVFTDYEKRMRRLERVCYIGIGALAVIEMILKK